MSVATAVEAAHYQAASQAARQPASQAASTAAPAQRLRVDDLTEAERNFSLAIHLSPLISFVGVGPLALLVPLIIWVIRKDESAFNDDHGRELINFGLSLVLYHFLLGITIIGLLVWPVIWVVALINVIRAAVAAGRGEYFRYPITIRFLP